MGVAILQLLIAVAGGTLLAIWITRYRLRQTKSPETDAEYQRAGFALKPSWIHGGSAVSGAIEGVPFTFTMVPRSRANPPTVVLTTPCALDGAFVISSEDASDRYFKRVGLAGELQIGDADFDREVFIQDGAPDYLKSLFGQAQAREAVRGLFRLGYQKVVLWRGVLSAYRYDLQQLPKLVAMGPALVRLAALGATQGVVAGAKSSQGVSSSARIVIASLAVMVFAVVIGAVGNRNAPTLVDGQGTYLVAIWLGIAALTIALGILAVVWLRGRPTGPGEMAFIIFLVLPCLVFGMWGGLMHANLHFDGSAAQEHIGEGKRRHSVMHANQGQYFVEVTPLHTGGRQLEVALPQAQGGGQAGQRWVVRTRSGWLGLEWLESARPVPGPAKTGIDAPPAQAMNFARPAQGPVKAVDVALSQWLNAAQYQQEYNAVTRAGRYPYEVEGRCEAGSLEFRAHWRPTPAGMTFLAYAGMTRDDYGRRHREYGARGYYLESIKPFKDCAGADRYSVTWLK